MSRSLLLCRVRVGAAERQAVGRTGICRVNRFETLCKLATRERWCWKILCTTCGHHVFRWALKALARGLDPSASTWSVHWGGAFTQQDLERLNGPLPPFYPWDIVEQERIQRSAVGCDIQSIASAAEFPDWLGYFGILLCYTEEVEERNRVLTAELVPQLRRCVASGSPAERMFEEITRSGRTLRWPDLEVVEMSYDGLQVIRGGTRMTGGDFAAGASAARNKLASYLRENGINVRTSRYGCPPDDEDFLQSVLALFRDEPARANRSAVVIFHWWQLDYKCMVALSVLQDLERDPTRVHHLFTARGKKGDSSFYVQRSPEGPLQVYRKKHWWRGQDAVEPINTTIISVEE